MAPSVPVDDSPAGPRIDRAAAALAALTALALALLLARVQPDPRGIGTHVQLGMSPCAWPEAMGMPCPTCGATTAACHLVHLQPLSALRAQPFGAALAAAGLALGAWGAAALVTGRSFLDPLVRLPYGTILGGGLVLFFGAWTYKILTFGP